MDVNEMSGVEGTRSEDRVYGIGRNSAPTGITSAGQQDGRVENGDGTVTVQIEFEVDPEVSAEMAKAMPKGETREDQTDKIEDETSGGEGEDRTSSASETVQQEAATSGEDSGSGLPLFSDDALTASQQQEEDAEDEEPQQAAGAPQKARRADTPVENCRAKDPMYCPYHGTQRMTQILQDEFKSRGIDGTVEVSGKGSRFKVSFTVAAQDEQSALAAVDSALMGKKGVKKVTNAGYETQNDGLESKFEGEGKVEHEAMAKPSELLGEWVDNIVEKLANDPESKKEVSRKDFIDMIVKVGEMHKAEDAAAKAPEDANLKAAADAAYQSASGAVDVVTAMMDFSGVNTVDDAKTLSDGYDKTVTDAKAKYAPMDAQVKAKKQKLFGPRGAFPPGFAKTNPWASVKLSSVLSDFSTTGKALCEAQNGMKAAYGAVAGAGRSGSDALGYADRKQIRVALQKMESAADMVAGHAEHNEERSKELLAKLDEWEKANPGGIQKAAPKPKKAAKKAASGTTSATAQQQTAATPAAAPTPTTSSPQEDKKETKLGANGKTVSKMKDIKSVFDTYSPYGSYRRLIDYWTGGVDDKGYDKSGNYGAEKLSLMDKALQDAIGSIPEDLIEYISIDALMRMADDYAEKELKKKAASGTIAATAQQQIAATPAAAPTPATSSPSSPQAAAGGVGLAA